MLPVLRTPQEGSGYNRIASEPLTTPQDQRQDR